jgi:hypothetical protein
MAHRQRADYASTKRRRLRARKAMFALAASCSLVAIGIGGFELATEGWSTFVDRPAGVGATPPSPAPLSVR